METERRRVRLLFYTKAADNETASIISLKAEKTEGSYEMGDPVSREKQELNQTGNEGCHRYEHEVNAVGKRKPPAGVGFGGREVVADEMSRV
jgi:hypothetical protein